MHASYMVVYIVTTVIHASTYIILLAIIYFMPSYILYVAI